MWDCQEFLGVCNESENTVPANLLRFREKFFEQNQNVPFFRLRNKVNAVKGNVE